MNAGFIVLSYVFAQIQSYAAKPIEWLYVLHVCNKPKYAIKTNQELCKAKNFKYS